MKHFTRRQALSISGCALAAAAIGIRPAFAANNQQELIDKFTGGKSAKEDKVTLDLPQIADAMDDLFSENELSHFTQPSCPQAVYQLWRAFCIKSA